MNTEVTRSNVTESGFRAACRRALRKVGMAGWIDYINDCGRMDGTINALGFTECHPFDERICERIGEVQYYCKDKDGHGYNFIWEWTPCAGEGKAATGYGYFFCIEF
jgi:hypothetical protein